MYFNIPGAKDILIKNMTGEDLEDIYLSFEGIEKHPLKISNIRKDGQVAKTLILSYLHKTTELKLHYFMDNEKQEIAVYDNLNKNDLRKLIITIYKKGEQLDVKTTVDEKNI
ncbi:hypothetical protein [Clostridium chromiireducens]|uniref:Uncharacterized protein n=1 Tax=Clostridium chromiireducens TaxID=225345 RepID=A0A1V4IW46_9CLOT|nr:hypothetical protein [Clostridium chromiireducens]OPJ64050.1 hypothetical protein CLCHR_12970 [Clostridium chromiireducens]RII32450.1 hypothetical protein D2A34_22520 [Clostridium chromiireducens]